MIGLTEFAWEFARSVTVNAIAPGFIDTDMTLLLMNALEVVFQPFR